MKRKELLLEVCANGLESAINAQRSGAHRIELCEQLEVGGVTPAFELIEKARALLSIPIHVLIRPRAGDFFYSDDDFKRMRDEINAAKRLGANGVVFGILNRDCSVDTERCKELIEFASPILSVFHRAFDVVSNPFIALDELIGLGFSHVLTSGQKETVADGISLIRQLVQHADHRITILAGGGITEENIAELVAQSGTNEFHFSAKVRKKDGILVSDEKRIRMIIKRAQNSWNMV